MAPSPKLIGKYEILAELGRGGFAVVYKARDVELDRIVALKVLHAERSYDPGFVARFRQEARASARLKHPHIVTIYDATQIDERLIIAMQYMEGHTLRDELAQGPLSFDRTLAILEQIASALDYAHQQGVVHRDVKPANILLEDIGQGVHATLLDFGLAKAMEASTALTSQGTLLGSPEYMAPEQADPNRANEIGPATDRYALGIVAYQLLTGRVPFPGNTPATLNAHLNLTPPDPHILRSEVPPQVSAALLKMLAKAPADRYASAGEFIAALRMAAVTPVSAPQVTVPRSAQSPIETPRKPEVVTPVPSIPRKGLDRVWRMLLWLLAVLLIGFVCYKIISELVKPPSPSISSFTTSPSALMLGECTSLSWQTTNVATPIELQVNKDILQTNLPASGSTSHCPTTTGQFLYSLEVAASPTQRRVSATAIVDVVAPAPTPQPSSAIDSFTANPNTLALGECTTLSWLTTNAVTPIVLEVNGQTFQTNLSSSGSTSHCPTAAGEYVYSLTITASPTQGPVSATAAINVVPKLDIGSTRTRTTDGMTMVYVPAGTFKMGSETGNDNEQPVHDVILNAFWIDRTEVTNAQYAKCVSDRQCDAPSETKSNTRDPYYGSSEYADYPVISVNWFDANNYCAWAGAQLPTEAQWEYAAQGTDGRKYPWGNTSPTAQLANYNNNIGDTNRVGSYPAGTSWVGAFDMAGNVWEWTADWFGPYSSGQEVNPTGPAFGEQRVLRGGAWESDEMRIRVEQRGGSWGSYSSAGWAGFRCAMAQAPAVATTPTPLPHVTPVPTPTKEPTFGVGSTRTRTTDGMTMVYVPGGTFKMGSDTGVSDDGPIHDVTLDAFWIDRTEVTNAQYAECVAVGQCESPSQTKSHTRNFYYGNSQYDNFPVIHVGWNDADKYCKWAGGQLPTEAQWEYAARGPNSYTYPWGNTFDGTQLNFCDKNCPFDWADKTVDDGYADTAPVGSYPVGASWVGALDLAGNVREWVNDWYGSYPNSAQPNPTGPTSGSMRLLRGGSWNYGASNVLTARDNTSPDVRYNSIGFRCVVSPGE